MFDMSSTLEMKLFGISSTSYHHVSDITTETYICLILIHLCGLRNEDTMMKLRYLAFGLVWFAKLGDGWESVGEMVWNEVVGIASPPTF